MIDSVYKSVQIILNKNAFGYISPSDFNQHALNAQLEIFQNYFTDFNKQTNLENVRRSGTGLADLSKKIAENIETFSVSNFLTPSSNNVFSIPSLVTTGDIAYMMGKILTYTEQLYSGNNSIAVTDELNDFAAAFSSSVVKPGDIVLNVLNDTVARVVVVNSATRITLTEDIFTGFAAYKIYSARSVREAEKISHSKATMLNTSLLTNPNTTFPAYTQEGELITLFPSTINALGMVEAQYYRYPAVPKWTYVSLTGGAPSFDQSAADYQDFEIPQDEEVELVIKICQYAGVSIREPEVVNFAKREQKENDQPKM